MFMLVSITVCHPIWMLLTLQTTISDLIQISPQDIEKPGGESLEDNINAKYANKVQYMRNFELRNDSPPIRSFKMLGYVSAFMIYSRLLTVSLVMEAGSFMSMVSASDDKIHLILTSS